MKPNVGTIDRILRFIIGIGLISLVFLGPQTPWGWIGVVPLGTALLSWFRSTFLSGSPLVRKTTPLLD